MRETDGWICVCGRDSVYCFRDGIFERISMQTSRRNGNHKYSDGEKGTAGGADGTLGEEGEPWLIRGYLIGAPMIKRKVKR